MRRGGYPGWGEWLLPDIEGETSQPRGWSEPIYSKGSLEVHTVGEKYNRIISPPAPPPPRLSDTLLWCK